MTDETFNLKRDQICKVLTLQVQIFEHQIFLFFSSNIFPHIS
uniref:Uncharacterized protein n=1 Tax=Anguilla anguilla TaxID=7936 RepID=A0A0E9U829_ANGAN